MQRFRQVGVDFLAETGRRCLSSSRSGDFVSQLPQRNVAGPFSDPQRVQQYSASGKDSTAKESVAEPKVLTTTADEVIQAVKKQAAVDELNALKESLEKMDKAVSSTSSGGSSDDGGQKEQKTDDYDYHSEAEKRRRRMEKNTRVGGLVVLGGTIVGSVAFALYYGRAKRDEAGNVIPDQYDGQVLAPFYRIIDGIWKWKDFVAEPSREVLLPDPLPAPYLQPKYTLVIEMKNVLVNPQWTYKTGYRFAKRPALDYFLDVIGYPNFEVVIYTSESAMTAMPVLDTIDPKQRIMFRLFRDCTKYSEGKHLKDLSKLNRDLSKVIYIDFDALAGSMNPENMLRVPEWKGNADDTSLVDLAELLKTIHLSDVDDVRPTIQYYSQFDDPAKEFRRRAVYLAEQEEKKGDAAASEPNTLKRYSGRLFGFRRHQAL